MVSVFAPHSLWSRRPSAWACGLVVVAVIAGGCGDGDAGSDTTATDDETGDDTSNDTERVAGLTPAEACLDAVMVQQGRFEGNLRGSQSDLVYGGACGQGGPDVFMRVRVPLRADLQVAVRGQGFTPRLGLGTGCVSESTLACGESGQVSLRDVQAGTVLDLAIGMDAAEFDDLTAMLAPEDGPDPLAFVLELGMTQVLAAGVSAAKFGPLC